MRYTRTAPWSTRILSLIAAALLTAATSAPRQPGLPPPIDPERWQDQEEMTWDDYRPIPGVNWADPSRRGAERNFRVALIAVDFPDQPFVITQPRQSDPFGNPQIDPIRREDVPKVARIYPSRNQATGPSLASRFRPSHQVRSV